MQMDESLLNRARKYCAASEHCKSEVALKLVAWGADKEIIKPVIRQLEEENFISEKRYAEFFTRSKINQNKWGLIKIEYELFRRAVPEKIITEALNNINRDKYMENLASLIKAKSNEIKENNPLIRKQKLLAFLTSKGYEYHLVKQHFDHLNL
jgi:regulatory protein